MNNRGANSQFDVFFNPEYLKEGAAVDDFMCPDRVVVGVESEKAMEMITKLYNPFMLSADRKIFTDIFSA